MKTIQLTAETIANNLIEELGMEKSQAVMKELELQLTKQFGIMVKGVETDPDPYPTVSPEGTV